MATTLQGKLMIALDEIIETMSNGKMSVNITSISDPDGLDVRITNTTNEPVPVVIQNVDSTIDLDVRIAENVTIDTSTPLDVDIQNTNLNVTVQNASLNTSATIQNSYINVYDKLYDGASWVNQKSDSDGRAINKDQKYYSSADITALGASTDITVWTSAFADGILTYSHVGQWSNEFEATTYYTHPDLGDNNNCLKEVKIYTTQNNAYVVNDYVYSVASWTFDSVIKGSVGVSTTTPVDPDPNDADTTNHVVCTITVTDNTFGDVTLSLSGTNASLYGISDGTSTANSFTYDPLKTYTLINTSNLNGASYSHSLSLTVEGVEFGVTDSVNISLSGTYNAAPPFVNDYYARGSINSNCKIKLYADFDLSNSWSISWWVYSDTYTNRFYYDAFFPITTLKTTSYTDEIYGTYYPAGLYCQLYNNSGGGNPDQFGFANNNNSGGGLVGYASNYDAGRYLGNGWKNVIVTWDSTYYNASSMSQSDVSNGLNFYFDNVQVSKDATRGATATISPSDYIFTGISFGKHAGGYTQNEYYVSGRLDEVGIWTNHLLSSSERSSIYNSGTPQDLLYTSGLTQPTRYWNMESTNLVYDVKNSSTQGSNTSFQRIAH